MFWYYFILVVVAILFLSWPFYLVYKGEKYYIGVLWTWILAVIYSAIVTSIICSLKTKGYEVEDLGNPMAAAMVSGWLPGIFVSGLSVGVRRIKKGKCIESDVEQEGG